GSLFCLRRNKCLSGYTNPVSVNSSRGNKYYGGCAATSKKCARPANREAAPDTETDSERWAPPFQERRRMGLLSALLQWNELDPPSRSEQRRNDRVCSLYQHNRNPFVDHPEYANLIWRNTARKFRSVTQKNSERLGSMSSTTKYENEVHDHWLTLFSLVFLVFV
uniref:Uncharacterized protein n=1 Tax=Aegilops tauschii subsp. strangulata TaxID=200361 RepID=A0A453E829_AEGTS